MSAISEADAVAEGIEPQRGHPGRWTAGDGWSSPSAREAFKALWSRIHGDDSWDANPWVVTVSFSVALANIDTPEATP